MQSLPGFVDLQVNGFKGVDFSNPELTEDEFITACNGLLDEGTAAFLPTIITSSPETFRRNLPMMSRAIDHPDLKPHIPGLHVEGPFLSPEPGAVGAHNPDWVRAPSVEYFDELYELAEGRMTLMTIAADQPGAAELCRHATSRGVVISLGHHLAADEHYAALSDAGAGALTHLGNGLPNMLPRLANPIWSGLAADALTLMIISDGHHIPRSTLIAMIRSKGVENTVVVSDAAPVAGLPPGRYHMLGNDAVLEESGLFHNPEKGCMVGSSATMMRCMNYLASMEIFSTEQIVAMGLDNPAALIGLKRESIVGRQAVTYDAAARQFVLD